MELSVPIKSIRSFFALQKEMESTQDGLYSFMEKFQLSLPLGFYFALDLLKSENFGWAIQLESFEDKFDW